MNININLNAVAKCVKNLVDITRCRICDTNAETPLRYSSCGHTVCASCFCELRECIQCITLTDKTVPVEDYVLYNKIKHANDLLKTCENLLNIDVYKRNRISDQEKKVNELFPQGIQGSIKYFNKRKNVNNSSLSESNQTFMLFPGEETIPKYSMDRSYNYVKQWLESNVDNMSKTKVPQKREPFSDLKVNIPIQNRNKTTSTLKKRFKDFNNSNLNTSVTPDQKHRTLKPTEHWKGKERASIVKEHVININRNAGTLNQAKKVKLDDNNKSLQSRDYNKSIRGINVVHENPIIIEDSQSENADYIYKPQGVLFDKDQLACQAVLDAEGNENLECSNLSIQNFNISKNANKIPSPSNSNKITKSVKKREKQFKHKVPFLKRGPLYTAKLSSCTENNEKENNSVAVTIKSNSFTTTIQVQKHPTKYIATSKQSSACQTDFDFDRNCNLSQITPLNEEVKHIKLLNNNIESNSENLFTIDNTLDCVLEKKFELQENKPIKEHKNPCNNVVIDDSESDDCDEQSNSVQVTADVHQSDDQLNHNVLAEIEPFERSRKRASRTYTPNSTDSSDKENINPNRVKKQTKKKNCKN